MLVTFMVIVLDWLICVMKFFPFSRVENKIKLSCYSAIALLFCLYQCLHSGCTFRSIVKTVFNLILIFNFSLRIVQLKFYTLKIMEQFTVSVNCFWFLKYVFVESDHKKSMSYFFLSILESFKVWNIISYSHHDS